LIRLHLESRRVTAALATIAACALTLRIALYWSWDTYGALQLPLMLESGCAAAIGITVGSPFGEPERATGRWLPLLRLGSVIALTVTAVAAFAFASIGADLAGGMADVVRNVAGLVGIGLLCATLLGGGLAWTGPVVYMLVGTYGLYADWHPPALTSPWVWPARPPHDLGGALCAAAVFTAGVAAATWRGGRELSGSRGQRVGVMFPAVGSPLRVVRAHPGLTWRALDNGDVVGAITAFLRPDNRWFAYFDSCRADAYRPLLAAVVGNVEGDLHATADEGDSEAAGRLIELGFTENRREGIYLLPTDPGRTGLADVAVPDDTVIISAASADEDDLRLLDEALRKDVPGSDGWEWDPAEFHAETFGDDFDPATYLVAADAAAGGGYIGLARIWIGPGTPRLGLIAVLRPYRRRGVARALLARAFSVLHDRGQAEVTAEIDDTNTASLTLLKGLGARRKSGTVEFVRRLTS
jgi:GNAT superfamily N-acetyltransferase